MEVPEQYMQRIIQMARVHSTPGWGGEDEEPVQPGTDLWAEALLMRIPDQFPLPNEMYVDLDGWICFKWLRSESYVRASVSCSGSIMFAANNVMKNGMIWGDSGGVDSFDHGCNLIIKYLSNLY